MPFHIIVGSFFEHLCLIMNRILLAVAACAASVVLSPAAFSQQQQCVQVAAFVSPNLLRCQAVGRDYLGKTIWLCC